MKTVFLIVGKSGSGKSTICDELVKSGLKQLPSYTTRPPRYEDEGNHIFISQDEVKNYLDEMVGYTIFNGHKYFATKDQLMESDLYVIDPKGIEFFKQKAPEVNAVVIHIMTRTYDLVERMRQRGDSEDKIMERLEHDDLAFEDVDYDYAISNVNFHRTMQIIKEIIKSYGVWVR